MDYTRILIQPVVSEKANTAKEEDNQVAFYVAPSANKIEIKRAVEEAFGVKVAAVNVSRKKPLARKRWGRTVGRVSGHKKAWVTLAPGEKIDLFEGV